MIDVSLCIGAVWVSLPNGVMLYVWGGGLEVKKDKQQLLGL
jgi:hypothetical protein